MCSKLQHSSKSPTVASLPKGINDREGMSVALETVFEPASSVGAKGYSERPAFANSYAVAGRFISIQASDSEISKLLERYFAGWHIAPVARQDSVKANVNIVFHNSGDQPEPPANLIPFEVAEGGQCRSGGQMYFFENNGSVVMTGHAGSATVEVWIGNHPASRARAPMARLIFNAAMVAMRRCGLYELHAAGVVTPSGQGVLIIGPSGSGKSNLAAQLASAGWQYLSDDSLLLFSRDGEVHTHALRRMFALTDEIFSATGVAESDSIEVSIAPFDPLKKRFEPAPLFPGQFVQACTPRKILFSRIEGAPNSRIQLLNRAETMARLIRMCPWACYDKTTAEAHLEVLGELARQADGFELYAGADLLNSERASEFLLSRFAGK